jgi:hypothetical protein
VLEKLANVGEIEVQVTRCRISERYDGNRGPLQFKGTEDAVPEKALKGRSISSRTK